MNYEEWEQSIPEGIREDVLWRVQSYRIALLISDLCQHDLKSISKDRHLRNLGDQLVRAAGSISANIAEGYSRSSGKDQARFYEYALGSSRETRDWYYKVREALPVRVLEHRIALLNQVIRLLLRTIPNQRSRKVGQEAPQYMVNENAMPEVSENQLQSLLAFVPLD